MLPTHYQEVSALVHEGLRKGVDRAKLDITQIQETAIKNLAVLNRKTIEYLETGIADLSYSPNNSINVCIHAGGWGTKTFSWHRYFQLIAKEMKRPYVYFGRHFYGTGRTTVVISRPDRRYTDPLFAMFTVLDHAKITKQGSTITLELSGNNANELILFWRNQCFVDPVMRKALRLP